MDLDDQDLSLSPGSLSGQDDSQPFNISDVIEVIQTTDPDTATAMFQNQPGGDIQQPPQNQPPNGLPPNYPTNRQNTGAYVEITEQPAPKAIRFRYECEGRSAGSIPGLHSTQENKTFPSIRVCNYTGRAVVVVSCVTKDHPYKPHPHRLVGKEGCKKGVCTIEINSETMSVTFSNLGIQCVKRKDIESALRLREDIRVDPFRTGFSHRNQPTSIDLNAVRLCFQVFLEGENGPRFTVPLPPVVSDPIYDKKGTSELIICKMSDCSAPCAGGKEIILLCEKVAKEDIKVRFFEQNYNDDNAPWEAYGDFNHTNVHKQVAISFKVPKYKTLEIDKPVKVFIQLKRPSDDIYSEPLPFEYLPLDSGRRTYLSVRRNLEKKGNMDLFQQILADDSLIFGVPPKEQFNNNDNNNNGIHSSQNDVKNEIPPQILNNMNEVIILDTPTDEHIPEQEQVITSTAEELVFPINTVEEKTNEWLNSTQQFENNTNSNIINNDSLYNNSINNADDDKTLNELLEQVAELDQIYTDHQLRRDNNLFIENELKNLESSLPREGDDKMDIDEIFDDAATYTSLQRAFKNPVPMIDIPNLPPPPPDYFQNQFNYNDSFTYDLVEPPMIINPIAPVIDVSPLKREKNEEEKLPPLPPKRVKKQPESPENNENKPTTENELNISRHNSTRSVTPRPTSQPIIIMKTPDSPPSKRLPPKPNSLPVNSNTLPKQKKSGFFSKLFSRKKSKNDVSSSTNVSSKNTPMGSREPSVTNFGREEVGRGSFSSLKTFPTVNKEKDNKKMGKPVGRSVSSVSGKRPNIITPDIIHIPLKGGDSTNSLPQRSGSGTHLSLPGNEAYEKASTIQLSPNDRRTVSALQLADLPLQDGNMELIAIADAVSLKNLCEGQYGVQLDPSVDLTEAEHYALYTSVAPCATASEFDETSCYYAPVEAGEILTPAEVAKRLTNNL